MRDWSGGKRKDPVRRARKAIPEATSSRIEANERTEIERTVTAAREKIGHRAVFEPKGPSA